MTDLWRKIQNSLITCPKCLDNQDLYQVGEDVIVCKKCNTLVAYV